MKFFPIHFFIGYGNIFPRTQTGRLFTVVYAIFGISITGIVLIKIGAALGKCIKKSDEFWEKQVMKFKKSMENPKVTVHITQLLITLLIALLIIWVIPACVLVKMEGWDFATATYFSFITMTTIGLGDITPSKSSDGGQVTKKEMLYQVSHSKRTIFAPPPYVTICHLFWVPSLLYVTGSKVTKFFQKDHAPYGVINNSNNNRSNA